MAGLSLKALGEDPSLPLAASGRYPQSLACRSVTLVPTSVVPWRSPYLSVRVSLFLKDTSHIGLRFRAHPNPVRPHLKLIISAETLFSNKVPFTDFG